MRCENLSPCFLSPFVFWALLWYRVFVDKGGRPARLIFAFFFHFYTFRLSPYGFTDTEKQNGR